MLTRPRTSSPGLLDQDHPNHLLCRDIVWLVDDAIPNYGTTANTQIIVSAPAVAMVLCEGEGVTSVFPETEATHLGVILNVRKYVSAVTRRDAGTSTVHAEAYKASAK